MLAAGRNPAIGVIGRSTATDAISDKLWAQYNYQIAKLMGNATGPNVQILPTALAISPAATAEGLDIQSQLEVFAGNIPDWDAVYAASSYKVLDAYREVLMQIKPAPDASAELQAQFATQQKAADAAAKAVSSFKLSKLRDWKDQNDEYAEYGLDGVTFADFLKDF